VINLWQDYGDGVARQKGQTTYDNINKEVDWRKIWYDYVYIYIHMHTVGP
jgi:uncharacterized protein YjlB